MAERKVDLKKNVFSKSQYIKTIDTQFSELGVTTLQEDLASQIDVNQFFQLYNDLFYEIPSNGATNSHEYLVKTSGEYINFDLIQEEIEALREEISGLREENLELQVEVTKFQTGEDIDVGSLIKQAEEQIQTNE
jgi:uridine kinase